MSTQEQIKEPEAVGAAPPVDTNKPVPPLPVEDSSPSADPTPALNKTPGPTRRLSLFINKTKKSIANAAERLSSPDSEHPKKPSESVPDQVESPPPVAEPNPEEASPTDKTEKRRSRLFENLFVRGKSPVKSEEHQGEIGGTVEHQVTSAEDDAEPPVPPPKDHKETTAHMLDQIKRSAFVNKWFAKKKESETSANEAGAAPPPISTEAKPDDAPLEDAAAEKKPGSPLGRRLTQILRSLPSKKGKTKKPSSSSTSSSSPSPAPEEPAREDETQEQQIHPAAATTATANNTASTAPIVQATA